MTTGLERPMLEEDYEQLAKTDRTSDGTSVNPGIESEVNGHMGILNKEEI